MRSGAELAKKDGLAKRWYESGFLVVWTGVIGALLAKWVSARLHLAPEQRALAILVTALVGAYLMWRNVIQYR
ncbi:hyaluronan synthase [Apiospora sp. TS-2023a]